MGLIVGLNSQHGLGLRSDGQKYTKASENNELEGKHIQSDSTLLGCRKRVVICNGMVVLPCLRYTPMARTDIRLGRGEHSKCCYFRGRCAAGAQAEPSAVSNIPIRLVIQ